MLTDPTEKQRRNDAIIVARNAFRAVAQVALQDWVSDALLSKQGTGGAARTLLTKKSLDRVLKDGFNLALAHLS